MPSTASPSVIEPIRALVTGVLQGNPKTTIAVLQALVANSATNSNSAEKTQASNQNLDELILDITADDLQPLVTLRQLHQSKQAEKGVRNYKPGGMVVRRKPAQPQASDIDQPLSTRQQLTQQINSLIYRAEERGSSTGLNRITRWTQAGENERTTKLTASTGNTANAELAAKGRASQVSTHCY